ncbi:MAG: hypothetical protein WCI05_13390 [Myxococcales bacterium]
MNAVTPTVSREVLEETPARALKLLRAVGTSLPIRAALAERGYIEQDHQEGWTLLHAASGYRADGAAAPQVDLAVRDAIRALDEWDEGGFRIVRASLERRHPVQAKIVLDGIGPSVGPAAVVNVRMLLERLDALAASKNVDDQAAMVTIAKRGLDEAERERLLALVKQAEAAPQVVPVDKSIGEKADAKHVSALVALRAWFEEWSEIARASVKRRDYLILLGLAKRKRKGATPAKPPDAPSGETGE